MLGALVEVCDQFQIDNREPCAQPAIRKLLSKVNVLLPVNAPTSMTEFAVRVRTPTRSEIFGPFSASFPPPRLIAALSLMELLAVIRNDPPSTVIDFVDSRAY